MKKTFIKTYLTKTLGLRNGEVISVVGGGGKTSIIKKLAKEILEFNSASILITATTNIFFPENELESSVILGTEQTIAEMLNTKVETKNTILTLARKKIGKEIVPNQTDKNLKYMKLKGFKKQNIKQFIKNDRIVLVEADGSKGLPIKAPNSGEPVIPEESNYILGVIGLDAIGLPVSKENVFRQKQFCEVTGMKNKMKVSPESIASLIKHPNGIFQNSPKNAKRAIILNKADCIDNIDEIEKIAYIINKLAHFPREQTDRLVITSCHSWESCLVYTGVAK